MKEDNKNRKEIQREKLIVSRVYKSSFQKENTLTAEVKQTIITKSYYPKQSISNEMQDNPFSYKEFGLEEKDYINTETRVAWFDVPLNSTVETVSKAIPENANLYKVMSNKPILTRNQVYGIDTGLTTLDSIATKQLVRYSKNHPNSEGIIFDKYGKLQYKAVFYKSNITEDEDRRTEEPEDFFATEAMLKELETGENTPELQIL